VPVLVQRGQNRSSRNRHPQGGAAQRLLEIQGRGHPPMLRPFLDPIKTTGRAIGNDLAGCYAVGVA
jgi:hypothetical protein